MLDCTAEASFATRFHRPHSPRGKTMFTLAFVLSLRDNTRNVWVAYMCEIHKDVISIKIIFVFGIKGPDLFIQRLDTNNTIKSNIRSRF